MVSYLKDLMRKVKDRSADKEDLAPEVDRIKEDVRKIKEPVQAVAGEDDAASQKSSMEIKKESKPRGKMFFSFAPAKEETPLQKDAAEEQSEKSPDSEDDKALLKSEIEKKLEAAKKVLVTSYGDAKIYRVEGESLLYYQVPVPRPTGAERAMINTIKEAATRLISIAPYKIRDEAERRSVYYQRIIDILRESPALQIPENRWSFYADAVVREMVGYGLIDSLVKDDYLEEIMVIGPKKPVYVFHREYEMMTTSVEFYSDKEIQDLVNRVARIIGRRVDISSPLLDARLPDGSRVNATIPPASTDGSTLTIRKFKKDPYSIIDLVRMNTLSVDLAAFLWLCVEGMGVKPANILIAGGTGSGKTTMLNVMASFIPSSERVISIEDTAELNLPLKHWIRMEAKPPGLEGTGELTLDILTKNSLRMRPDRIIVGEIRHDEAFTLFTAMNTGHDGALTGDSLVQLEDGNILEIEKIVCDFFGRGNPVSEGDYEFVEVNEPFTVLSFNKENLNIEAKQVTHAWRKKTGEKIVRIKLRSGKTISLTKDHPVYRISNGIVEFAAGEVAAGQSLMVPLAISVKAENRLRCPCLVGMIYGDGHLGYEAIQFVNANDSLIGVFEEESKKLTENKVSTFDYEGYSRVQFCDKKLIREINESYEMPIGNKTKSFKFGGEILKSSGEDLALLLRGLFDCEAHVNLHSNSIQFSTSNRDLAFKLPLILQRFSIAASLSQQEKDGKGNIGPYYRISIYGKENLSAFEKFIGFNSTSKSGKLRELIGKAKHSIDAFPGLSRAIRDLRLEQKMTQGEFAAFMGNGTRSVIASYEQGARNPSREQLKKIVSFSSDSKTAKGISLLAESGLRFEEVVSVEEIDFEGYLYDLTVEGNHNYLANGMFASNCLGTVHANNSNETLVRLTNPPMNVPEIMLSSLDFILVENRIHDKKKGTIRRVTEISEVTGVLEGKAKAQTIFEWDAATDKLEKTDVPIAYLSELEKFTGFKKKQIETELAERTRFLQDILKKGTSREIGEVSSLCEAYINERRGNNAQS